MLSWIESAVNSVKIETIKNSFEACGISHRRFNGLFNSKLNSILENSAYKNPIYAEESWDNDAGIIEFCSNLSSNVEFVAEYGNEEDLLGEMDDLCQDSEPDFLDSDND